jgi:hypothetical protein
MHMHIQWDTLIAAAIGFSFASAATSKYVIHVVDKVIEAERHMDSAEELMRCVRQDIAGVLTALTVTNGLLGAITAALIIR